MKSYTIDYGTGVTQDVTGTLSNAQEIADSGAAYTQTDIVILDDAGAEVARRRWWGVPYDPDVTEETPDEVIEIGSGHYGAWE